MPENCLFPLNGTGEGGREVGRGIRKEGTSVTLETAPEEWGSRDQKQRLGGPMVPRRPFLTQVPLCHSSFPVQVNRIRSSGIYCAQPCTRCRAGCEVEEAQGGRWVKTSDHCALGAHLHQTGLSTSQMSALRVLVTPPLSGAWV